MVRQNDFIGTTSSESIENKFTEDDWPTQEHQGEDIPDQSERLHVVEDILGQSERLHVVEDIPDQSERLHVVEDILDQSGRLHVVEDILDQSERYSVFLCRMSTNKTNRVNLTGTRSVLLTNCLVCILYVTGL